MLYEGGEKNWFPDEDVAPSAVVSLPRGHHVAGCPWLAVLLAPQVHI